MPTPPYDTVTTVMNAARTRLNDVVDTLYPIGGQILKNTQPFSQQTVNDAWRKLQEKLADFKYSGLTREVTVTAVPACTSTDPAVFVRWGYDGYFDGATLQPTPVLPQDMIRPYDLWERPNGSNAALTEMDPIIQSLPAVPKANWNRQWQWRGDSLYLPGALTVTDIRLEYAGLLPDFVDVASAPGPNQVIGMWYVQPVPIMRCLDSFADYICREYSIARGDMDGAAAFQASAESNARMVMNRDTTQGKSVYKYSELQKMADRFTPAQGPDTQMVKR